MKEIDFNEVIKNLDYNKLKELRDTISEECEYRREEKYKAHISNILTAINGLIDNGFGNEFVGIEYGGNWEDLRDDIKANFSCF